MPDISGTYNVEFGCKVSIADIINAKKTHKIALKKRHIRIFTYFNRHGAHVLFVFLYLCNKINTKYEIWINENLHSVFCFSGMHWHKSQ